MFTKTLLATAAAVVLMGSVGAMAQGFQQGGVSVGGTLNQTTNLNANVSSQGLNGGSAKTRIGAVQRADVGREVADQVPLPRRQLRPALGLVQRDDVDGRLAMGADLVMSATAAMWDPLLAARWKARQG